MTWLLANLFWIVPLAIVVLGLFVYGLGDLLRFSPRRTWAISSVAFSESIRRRVLWITPLAILAVIIVSGLQRPSDEQDAIRQMVKFSLFASGMVVVTVGMILACTNLPKEIESRVIYTIVTKPTTRLEIVCGKIIGFGKVSLTILAIMGLFTFAYLHLQAHFLRNEIEARLASESADPLSRATDEYYVTSGLLSTRTLTGAQKLDVLVDEPAAGDNQRWFYGNGDGDVLYPFELTAEQLTPGGVADALPGSTGLFLQLNLGYAAGAYGKVNAPAPQTSKLPIGVAAPSSLPTTTSSNSPLHPQVQVTILDANMNSVVEATKINGGKPIDLPADASGKTPFPVQISPDDAMKVAKGNRFFVDIAGISPGVKYSVDTTPTSDLQHTPAKLFVPGMEMQNSKMFGPVQINGKYVEPIFRTRIGLHGQQQLRGGPKASSPVGIYHFTGAQASDNQVGFELKTSIETNYTDRGDENDATKTEFVVINNSNGQRSDPVLLYPETSRTAFFSVPAQYTSGGNFDLIVRNLSEGHYVGLSGNTLAMVSSVESFDFNLIKSLAILWLLSMLVVTIAVFCSTFLSWPIAVVLTLILLLGHWGVIQLGDTLAPGIGNQVVTDFFGAQSSASQAKAVSASVEALAKILNQAGTVLPDIDQFSSIEQIEKGLTIPLSQLWDALKVLLTFGVPILVLSYVVLRNKEVAP